ncbi:MAG: hypothetical protein U5K56_10015 [Halioglobus sp.]|nr:hypothetical protein [Halioglobus sp.]
MRAFIAIFFIFVLAALSPVSDARDRRGGAHDGRAWQVTHEGRHHGTARHYRKYDKSYHKRHHYKPHHRAHHYRYKHYRPHHYRGYYHKRWRHRYRHGGHRRHDRYYPAAFGSALLGAVIGYQLFHTHDGAVCYDNHGSKYDRGGRRSRVVGCHRIEQLPGGGTRRVEVPLSQCR